MKRNILLICYSFPPHIGIGGRRWAKFAKYLSIKGYGVHVICAKHSGREFSEWIGDVKSEKIKIHELEIFYPRSLTNFSNAIVNKIAFQFWTIFFKLVSKGVIYERTFFWKKPLLQKAIKIITENNIKNVIVTIPPYRLAHHSLAIKLFNKNLNLIIDYRDPWTDNKTFHGFKNLSADRLNHEKKTEKEVLQKSNYVITTTEQMTNWAKEKLSFNKEKCITIPNGYDADEITNLTSNKRKSEKKIFLSAGSLYNDLEYLFIPFLKFIKKKEEEDENFSRKYNFKFYGEIDSHYLTLLHKSNVQSISFNGFIPRHELSKQYDSADFFVMFTVSDHAFNFNTKFYEYLAYKKPIVHFSNDGAVTQFLEAHQLGLGIKPNSFNEDMTRLFNVVDVENFNYNNAFDASQFSIEKLTQKIEQLLIE